jgi:tetratricopeptide (TPR) repeat protein
MTQRQPASEFRYWAFISYSHKDASWGRWLHKVLETYRLPKRLQGMPIAAGKVPPRLSPIFRDRDELPTASNLGTAIEEALRQSWCLIVICSPDSAQSRWVNEEVLAFQRLGRGNRIHCLIVDSGDDAAAPLAFPPALGDREQTDGSRSGEPIAADARRFGDGRASAKLKLIAGILGIGYDSLVQREHQRRHRNLFYVTCASLALVIVLAVSTLVAITSRRDAVDQRTHAESLVEFMIGDLRKKLEPDGKLATLDAVGKEALAYYAAQKSEDLDADGLARRARALHMIGEVYDLRGELDQALKVFEQAAESTAELVAREPGNGQRIFDHAQSVFWVGLVAYQRGHTDVAEPAFQDYKRLADRLVAIDPDNEDWQAEVGYANANLGVRLYEQGRLDEAAAIFSHELEMAADLGRRKPGDAKRQLRTAQAHAWLADVRSMQGQLEEAKQQRDGEIAIYERALVSNANDKSALEALSISELALAKIELTRGEQSASINHSRKALAHVLELRSLDSENTQWINIAAATQLALSEAFAFDGQLVAAGKAASQARELAEQLTRLDPSITAWQDRWVASLLAEAQLAAMTGDDGQAMALAQESRRYLEELPGTPLRSWQQNRNLARSLLLIADLEQRAGHTEAARQARESVVALGAGPGNDLSPEMKAARAVALLALGRSDEARPLLATLKQIGYRESSFVTRVRESGHELGLANAAGS